MSELAPAWVVSPHLLVAQAVAAALASAGTQVEVRTWEAVVQDARSHRGLGGTRYVVAIFDDPDGHVVVEQIGRLVAVGDVRVAVVSPRPGEVWWGSLMENGSVDVVARATSVDQLVEVVERLVSGDRLMEPERRTAARAAWSQALDNRRRLLMLMQTLSPQQLRVLECLSSGHRAQEVAHSMELTVGTVRSHVKALRAKLGARTQLEAVAMFRQAHDASEAGGSVDLLPRPRLAMSREEEPTPIGSGA